VSGIRGSLQRRHLPPAFTQCVANKASHMSPAQLATLIQGGSAVENAYAGSSGGSVAWARAPEGRAEGIGRGKHGVRKRFERLLGDLPSGALHLTPVD
jgi:hypothetical protein